MKQHTWKGKTVWFVPYAAAYKFGLFKKHANPCEACGCGKDRGLGGNCLYSECGGGLMIAETAETKVKLVELRLTWTPEDDE